MPGAFGAVPCTALLFNILRQKAFARCMKQHANFEKGEGEKNRFPFYPSAIR